LGRAIGLCDTSQWSGWVAGRSGARLGLLRLAWQQAIPFPKE